MNNPTSGTMSEMLPCPFCANGVTLKSDGVLTSIVCTAGSACRGSALIVAFPDTKRDEAIAAWNRRAQPAAQAVGEDSERAQFEEAILREWPDAPIRYKRDLLPPDDPRYNDYINVCLRGAWVGWKARAALAAPVRAVRMPDGFMIAERSIWTEEQVQAATASITLAKTIIGITDRDLAMAAIDAAQCKAPDITLADMARLNGEQP